jgi:hypothetical protein
MADNVDKLVQEGKLPNNPKVLDAIRADATGEVLKKVQARHTEFLSSSSSSMPQAREAGAAAQAPPPSSPATPRPGAPQSQTETGPPTPETKPAFSGPKPATQDDILTTLAKSDKIPNNPDVFNALKSGKVSLEQVQQRHAEFRKTNPIASLGPGLDINNSWVMNKTALDPEAYKKSTQDDLHQNLPALLRIGLPKTLGVSQPNSLIDFFTDPKGQPMVRGEPMQGGMQGVKQLGGAMFDHSIESGIYRTKKLAEGATFGIYSPEGEAPTDLDWFAGGLANLTGGFLTGSAIFKGVGLLKPVAALGNKSGVIGEGIQELKMAKAALGEMSNVSAYQQVASQLFRQQVKKGAVDLAKVSVESAITGFGVGATKGLLNGEDAVDILASGMSEATMWSAFGMAMMPVAGAAGKLFGRRQENRVTDAARAVFGRPESQAIAGQFEKMAEAAAPMLKPGVAGPLSPQQAFVQDGLSRMKATAPLIGVKMAALTNPELLLATSKGNAEVVANKLFTNGGPLEYVLNQSPRLKLLMSEGKYSQALEAAQTGMTDMLAKDPEAISYMMAPFGQNSSTLHKVYAERVINSVSNPERYPTLKSNLLNYMDTPSAENALLLKQDAPQGFLKKVAKQEFYDPRLRPHEVDQVVGDLFKQSLGKIAGAQDAAVIGGQIKQGITRFDDILDAAVTFNKEFHRSFIRAFQESPLSFSDSFVKARPEIMGPVQDAAQYRNIAIERDMTLSKRRDLNNALTDLAEQLRGTADPAEQQRLNGLIQATKDQRKTLTGVLAQQNRSMRSIETSLSALPQETLKEVDDFVGNIFIPKKTGQNFGEVLERRMAVEPEIVQLRKKMMAADTTIPQKEQLFREIDEIRAKHRPSRESTASFGKKFGDKENPWFVRGDSELADVMNAFVTAGRDFKESVHSVWSFPFIGNIENPRRIIARELGPNNVFEKSFTMIKDADAAIEKNVKKWAQFIDDLGIKPKSKESAMLQKVGEGRVKLTDQEFLSLPPESQKAIAEALPKTRHFYDTMIDSINAVMVENNLPQIHKRSDYFHHFGETMETIPNKIATFMRGDAEGMMFEGKGVKMFWKSPTTLDATRTNLSAEKARRGDEFVDDAITGMKLYTRPALERVFYADAIRQFDTARHFAPQEMGKFIQGIKEDFLLRTPNLMDKQTSGFLKKAAIEIRNRLGRGAILGNVNVALMQLLSIPSNFSVSPKNGAKALLYMNTKEGKAALEMSQSLIKRDALHMDIDKEAKVFSDVVLKKLGIKGETVEAISASKEKVSQYWQSFGSYAMGQFDKAAARHAYLTGYYQAVEMGATKQQAARFGDKWMELMQNDMTRISQPRFYQSVLGKSFGQFQSFVTNYAGTIMNDLPNIARTEGASKAVSMMVRTVAGLTIANETARATGVPAPYDLASFIPFLGNYRFGAPGLGSLMPNSVQALIGDDEERTKAQKMLQRSAATLSVSGGGQLYKVYDAFYDSAGKFRAKPSPKGRFSDAVFGRGRNIMEPKKEADAKKGFVGRTRSSLKKAYKEKVFGK